jgi:hypothetical protein
VFVFLTGQMCPSPLNLQTNSGAHGALCIVGVRQPGREANQSPHLVPRLIRRITIPQFPITFHGVHSNNISILKIEALCSSEASVFTKGQYVL